MTISNLIKMEENYPNRRKALWEKEKFLLFLHCFQKACFPGASKGVIVWEWVNGLSFAIQVAEIFVLANHLA